MSIPYPAPAPSPIPGSPGDVNNYVPTTDWGSLWNTAWNTGYNQANSSSNPYSGQSGGGYDVGQGYTLGQQAYLADMKAGQKTSDPTGGQVLGAKTGPTPTQPTGPSPQDQLTSEVSRIFDPVFSALQGQEQTLQQNYAPVEGQINTEYQNAGANLAQQKQTSVADINATGAQAGQRKEDAWTAARRLFDELQRGGQQRFGGASSAGEAYGTLTAVEQQRKQGAIQSAYETAMQQVGTLKAQVNQKYDLAVKELDAQKASAIIAAQQDFRDKLQAIQNAKAQAQSDKSAATLSTLQDFRNKVYTINQQSLVFAQQLAANHDITLKAVDDFTAKATAAVSGSQVIGTNFAGQAMNTAGQTNFGTTTGGGTVPTVPQYVGQMQSRPGQKWDPVTNSYVEA